MHSVRLFRYSRVALLAIPVLLVVTVWIARAAFAQTATPSRQELERELQRVQQEIVDVQKKLTSAKGRAKTLANKIADLQDRRQALELQVQATNLQIDSLDMRMEETEAAIERNQLLIIGFREQLSGVLRRVGRLDHEPPWLKLLSAEDPSDLSGDISAYAQVSDSLNGLVNQVKHFKERLGDQRAALEAEREVVDQLLAIKLLQQNELDESVREQNTLLRQTKGKESEYQNAIQDGKKQVADIQSRIYRLLEVEKQVTFGQAVEIADWVSRQTGVRSAFLLAVLSQESSLGANVGTCNRAGDPPSKSWKAVMKPDRDQVPFQTITKELGLDIDKTPVSCPMKDSKGNQVGWGGAMGPAQFIPSTWAGYRASVSRLTGKSPANPWDIRDAFVAAALLLKSNGANGTRQGEWNAAMRYFSGSTNPAYSFYGDSVLSKADAYQADIDQLKK